MTNDLIFYFLLYNVKIIKKTLMYKLVNVNPNKSFGAQKISLKTKYLNVIRLICEYYHS